MAHSDGTAPSASSAMSEEDKHWLEQVMKEAVRDDAQRMNEVMLKVKEGDFSDIENDLEDLRDIVEQVDMAQVFTKYGGCDVLIQAIEQREELPPAMKALAASVIATVAQNNLTAQDLMMTSGVVDKLANIFLNTTSDLIATKVSLPLLSFPLSGGDVVSCQVLYALSCTVRGHAAAEEYFVLKLGDAVFGKALQSRVENIVSRAAFLANALITSDYCSVTRIEKLSHLFIPAAFDFLATEHVDLKDHIYTLLHTLLQTSEGHALIRNNHHDTLSLILRQRTEQLKADSSSEDNQHELQLIANLQQATEHFRESYPTTPAKENYRTASTNVSNHNNNNSDDNTTDNTSSSSEPTVLLLAPPPLEASSEAP